METALRNAICAGLGCVAVVGGPGNGGGTNPYAVTFRGTDVPQLECESGTPPLSGGSGCAVATTTNGANGSINRYHADGSTAGIPPSLGSNMIDGRGPEADETPQKNLFFTSGTNSQVTLAPAGVTAGDLYVTDN